LGRARRADDRLEHVDELALVGDDDGALSVFEAPRVVRADAPAAGLDVLAILGDRRE
jgi:hypothetical protein